MQNPKNGELFLTSLEESSSRSTLGEKSSKIASKFTSFREVKSFASFKAGFKYQNNLFSVVVVHEQKDANLDVVYCNFLFNNVDFIEHLNFQHGTVHVNLHILSR